MKLFAVIAFALLLTGCNESEDRRRPAATELTAGQAELSQPAIAGEHVAVLALGDSLFTGYGLKQGETYPARLEAALRARGINATIVNAGLSGDTTAGGLQRLAFTLGSQAAPPRLRYFGSFIGFEL